MRLNTARNTYNQLIENINKYNSIDDFTEECGYMLDATIYYICDCLELECNDDRYKFLYDCIYGEVDFESAYENIHEISK